MGNNGRVVMGQGVSLESDGVVSNVATIQAEREREEKLNVDGDYIRPDWVAARGITLGESLRVGSGVTLTDGCVDTKHLAADSVTTAKIDAGAVTATEISVSTLSAISANLGTITAGNITMSGTMTIAVGSGDGIGITPTRIYIVDGGVTTFDVNSETGTMYFKGQIAANNLSLLEGKFSAGSIYLGSGGVAISSAADGAEPSAAGIFLGYASSKAQLYLTDSAGTPTVVLDGSSGSAYFRGDLYANKITVAASADNSVDLTQGSHTFATSIVVGATTLGGISNAATTGASKATTFSQDSVPTALNAGDLWIDTNDGNKTYRAAAAGANEVKAGEWVLYQDAGAAAGLTAVQPGNGFGVDANNYPNTILLDSSGIEIFTVASASSPRLLLNNAGLSAKASISGVSKDVVTIDSTNGIRVVNYTSTPGTAERVSVCYNNGTTTTEAGFFGGYSASARLVAPTGYQLWMVGAEGIEIASGDYMRICTDDATKVLSIGDATYPWHGGISVHGTVTVDSGHAIQAVHKAFDGSYKANGSFTFYAATSSGGSPTTLHTVTFEDGLIVSWAAA